MGVEDILSPVKVNVEAKAEVKGSVSERAFDRAVDGLMDAISPLTEGMGLIGDHIRAHRYDVAAEIAQKAISRSRAQGRPISPPPLKFMVPFLEKASTESTDEVLKELWTNLLVDSCDEFQGIHLTYIQILSEISGFEAQYLDSVADGYDIDFDVPPSTQMAQSYNDEFRPWFLRDSVDLRNSEAVIQRIYKFTTKQFCRPITVSFRTAESETYGTVGAHATTAYLLQRQNLVAIESLDTIRVDDEKGSHSLDAKVELACLTPLGADFVVSCIGR